MQTPEEKLKRLENILLRINEDSYAYLSGYLVSFITQVISEVDAVNRKKIDALLEEHIKLAELMHQDNIQEEI
jgi:hypothetical protein